MTLQETTTAKKKQNSTKNYDAVTKKVRKLLSATGQTFVPELCEALRKDWYPELSQTEIKNNAEARNEIRNRMYMDWSYDDRPLSDNIWSEESIKIWFPDWLRNPLKQASTAESLELANEAKLRKKILVNQAQKQKLEEMATKLPDSVIIPKQPEPMQSYEGEDLDIEGGRLARYGEKGKTISQMKGDITYHSARLFEALTEIDHLPHKDEDLTLDYIKPTRQFRKSLILELDEESKKTVWNALGAVEAAIQDSLDLLEVEMSK